MNMETKKIDDYTLQVTRVVPAQEIAQKYVYNFLLHQKEAIEKDLARYTAERQAELDEVNTLIVECEKLGIKPRSVDEENVL